MTAQTASTRSRTWRTPLVILVCAGIIGAVSFGPRSSFGLFLAPLSVEQGWGREVFAFALAIQNLLWGIGQPFAGALADRFGSIPVLIGGALLYSAGLAWMSVSGGPAEFTLSAGVLIGLGLSGCSFNVVLGALGKLLPPHLRTIGFGVATAAGSFGQFLFSPLASAMIGSIGPHETLLIFGAVLLLVLPASLALAAPRIAEVTAIARKQSPVQAIREALADRSYVLLVLGFFTCGFQLAFVTVHLPPYLADIGLDAWVGGWTIAVIGLANIVGSLTSGWLSGRMPKRYLLAAIYALRGIAIAVFVLVPPSAASSIVFGFCLGLLWLSTVPPTSGIVSVLFGTRYLTMLYGFAFFSHQVGGFLGVLLGGFAYERLGSYDTVWWLSVALSFASAIINLPIREAPVMRPAETAAA